MASVQIDEKAHKLIEKLPPEQQAAAMDAYAKRVNAGGAPPAELRQRWMQEAITEAEAAATNAVNMEAEIGVALADDGGALVVAGRPCRPMSAGVVSILERIKHPLAVGDAETEMTFEDIAVLLFCLTEDPRNLIAWSRNGGEQLRDEAAAWAFEIDIAELQAAFISAQTQYEVATGDIDEDDNTEEDPEKKTA